MDPVPHFSAAKRDEATQRDKIAIATAGLDWCVCVHVYFCVFSSVCMCEGRVIKSVCGSCCALFFQGKKRNAQTSWDKSFEYSREGTSGHLSFWFQGLVVSRWPIKYLSFLCDPFTNIYMLPYYFPVVELPHCHIEKGNCSFTFLLLLDLFPITTVPE